MPDLTALAGPVIACAGPRGLVQHSDAGYAALGQMVAGITGSPYAEAASRLVLRPLGMASSSFPASWPGDGAATGYTITADGLFTPAPATVATMPAAAGLWSTAEDLIRFGLGWSSLLPTPLAREALTPHAGRGSMPGHAGLGWIVNEASGVIGHGSTGHGGSASLLIPVGGGGAHVALTGQALIESVNPILWRRPQNENGKDPGEIA